MSEFVRIAHVSDGQPRIKDSPPLIYHANEQNDPEHKSHSAGRDRTVIAFRCPRKQEFYWTVMNLRTAL